MSRYISPYEREQAAWEAELAATSAPVRENVNAPLPKEEKAWYNTNNSASTPQNVMRNALSAVDYAFKTAFWHDNEEKQKEAEREYKNTFRTDMSTPKVENLPYTASEAPKITYLGSSKTTPSVSQNEKLQHTTDAERTSGYVPRQEYIDYVYSLTDEQERELNEKYIKEDPAYDWYKEKEANVEAASIVGLSPEVLREKATKLREEAEFLEDENRQLSAHRDKWSMTTSLELPKTTYDEEIKELLDRADVLDVIANRKDSVYMEGYSYDKYARGMGNSALYHPWTTKLTNVERELTHDADAEKSIAIFNKLNNPKNRRGLIEGEGESTIVNVAPKGLNDIQSNRYYSYLATLATFVPENVLNQYMIDGDSEKMYDNLGYDELYAVSQAKETFEERLSNEQKKGKAFIESMRGSGFTMTQSQRALDFLRSNGEITVSDLISLGIYTNKELLDDTKRKEAEGIVEYISFAYDSANSAATIGETVAGWWESQQEGATGNSMYSLIKK